MGFIGVMLRQPLIVSVIAVGILAGPSALNIARSDERIDLLAELGIAVLLFLVGLKLDLKLMRALGYAPRTGFLAGLTVAQLSEFSLIFMAIGVAIGHVNESALGLVTLVGLITIAASTCMTTYSHQLYAIAEPVLRHAPERTRNGGRGAWRCARRARTSSCLARDVMARWWRNA